MRQLDQAHLSGLEGIIVYLTKKKFRCVHAEELEPARRVRGPYISEAMPGDPLNVQMKLEGNMTALYAISEGANLSGDNTAGGVAQHNIGPRAATS